MIYRGTPRILIPRVAREIGATDPASYDDATISITAYTLLRMSIRMSLGMSIRMLVGLRDGFTKDVE